MTEHPSHCIPDFAFSGVPLKKFLAYLCMACAIINLIFPQIHF